MSRYKLRAESGPESGKVFPLPAEGLSVGRSARNDVAIADELLSRRHCRFYFEEGAPMVADLATVNGTLRNGVPIRDAAALRPGDEISIGGTRLRLSGEDGVFPERGPAPETARPEDIPSTTVPPATVPTSPPAPVDLGFGPGDAPAADGAPKSRLLANVVLGAVAVVALALAAKLLLAAPGRAPAPPPAEPPPPPPLEFSYVKLKGSTNAVFRYEMGLGADGRLVVAIDDTAQNRHVRRTGEPLAADVRDDLARVFAQQGFAALDPLYEGRARENEFDSLRLSALYEGRAFTVLVRNKPAPEALRELCERLETFATTELGLWAAAYGRDELIARAATEFNRAELLFEQRSVKPSNLFEAVRAYGACLANLDSLDPRPGLHDKASARLEAARKELDATVAELEKSAGIATNTKDWAAAAAALQEILAYVPDRTDGRNRSAFRRLREVQERMKK